MRIISAIAAAIAVTSFFAVEAESAPKQRTCTPPLIECRAGNTGSGGCYNPGLANCEDGMMCSAPLKVCRKGGKGGGGCYDISQYTCKSGKMCQISNPKVCTN
jgi:hypothetical protein